MKKNEKQIIKTTATLRVIKQILKKTFILLSEGNNCIAETNLETLLLFV